MAKNNLISNWGRNNVNLSLRVKLVFFIVSLIIITGLVSSCGGAKAPQTATPNEPSKVKFSEFTNFEMKSVGIAEEFASSGANQKALKKIDEVLFANMKNLFPNLKRIESGNDFSKSNERTLQITPFVKEIKFIGGGARFFVGAMAGSSYVRMKVTFADSSNNEIIADTEFYRVANAITGGRSMGGSDNAMLEIIAKDITDYSMYNR